VTLAQAQALFWRAVRAKRAPAELAQAFVGRGALDAKARMQIYRAAYWARHEKALQESYPELFERMGAQAFRTLVAGYIERYPSTVPAIERAGASLATYIADCAAMGDARAELCELARLEWARVRAVLAEDPSERFDPSTLASSDAPSRELHMAPSLSVVSMRAGARAVWRGAGGVAELSVELDEARALQRALAHATFGAVCAEFDEPDAQARAGRALQGWLQRGWITALKAPCKP
jgi:hypothetical protein